MVEKKKMAVGAKEENGRDCTMASRRLSPGEGAHVQRFFKNGSSRTFWKHAWADRTLDEALVTIVRTT